MTNSEHYFASFFNEKAGEDIVQKFKDYQKHIGQYKVNLYKKANWYFYQGASLGGSMRNVGMQAQFKMLGLPVFNSYAKTLYTLILSEAPTLAPVTTNTSDLGYREKLIAKGILDYQYDTKNKKSKYHDALLYAIIYGDGYAVHRYDAFEKDLCIKAYNPLNVAFDCNVSSKDSIKWHVIRDKWNKHELIGRYPYLEQKIKAQGLPSSPYFKDYSGTSGSDDFCYTYNLIHKKSSALPKGRYSLVLEDGTILEEGEYPILRDMVVNCYHYLEEGSGFGYTPMFDVLALQEASNATFSSILTGVANFGSKILTSSKNPTVSQIYGLTVFATDGRDNPPQAIDLLGSQSQHYEALNYIQAMANKASSLNDTVMNGSSAQSGSSKVFDQATAIRNSSGLKNSLMRMFQEGGNAALDICKQLPPQTVGLIVGNYNKNYISDWSGKDLDKIQQVQVKVVPFTQKSSENQMQFASEMLQYGDGITPKQVLNLANNGTLDGVFEDALKEEDLIQAENEMLLDGKIPVVSPNDDHISHADGHKGVVNDIHVRNNENPEVLAATNEHITQHLEAMYAQIMSNPIMFLALASNKEQASMYIQMAQQMGQQQFVAEQKQSQASGVPPEMEQEMPQEPNYPQEPTLPEGAM
jgi:hypothetical protein